MESSTSDWTAGYVADIGYTYGYYPELNPNRVRLAFANAGLACPEFATACELGFGQGLSANVHAATSEIQWYGTDFNPSQAAFARELAAASGSGARLYDEAFADFCNRADLPDFDYIALHGIWSWISDENRHVIVEFVRRKLKVGGVLYISYNTMPGWATFAPMRHLLTAHAEVIGSEGRGIVHRIDDALEFAQKLIDVNPVYARVNPQVAERVKQLRTHNRHYLAHEYFNRDWHPMHFATLSQWLAPAKVTFGCSANPVDHVEVVNLSAEQRQFLLSIPDASFRESVRDFIVNQQFRKDYWVKGPRKLAPLERAETLHQLRFVLLTPPSDVPLKVQGAMREASLSPEIYGAVLEAMSNHLPVSFGELLRRLSAKSIVQEQLTEVLLLLGANNHVCAAQDEAVIGKVRDTSRKLNAAICARARFGNEMVSLACPVTGGAVGVPRFGQLFLAKFLGGQKSPQAWADAVAGLIESQGQSLVKEGKPLGVAEQRAELFSQAKRFESTALPLLKALGVA